MSIDFDEKVKLFKEFQNKWNLERLKSMTLEEYTSTMLDSNEKRDDFAYWVEILLRNIGNIRGHNGGIGNLKFGICVCSNGKMNIKFKHYYSNNQKYAWLEKYGADKNEQEVFKVIKEKIISIAEASLANDLKKIEEIDFDHLVKWKIAFHYQNISDMKIINIFNKRWLEKIVGEEFGETDLKTYQMYQRILWDKKYSLVDILQKAKDCLKKYDFKDKKKKIAKGEDEKMQQDKNNTPLNQVNQILYGPPATGKTYNIIDRALEILASYDEGLKLPSQEDRKARKELFDEYRQKGQIEFVTFHQSYGYEEFVEGIKPKTDDNGNVVYEVEKGIFKKLCETAGKNLADSQKPQEILQKEAEVNNAILDFFDKHIVEETFFKKAKKGGFSVREIQNNRVYIKTEDTKSNLYFLITDFEKIVLSNRDFESSKELAFEVFGEKTYQSQIRTYMLQLYKEFRKGDFEKAQRQGECDNILHPYILIIDEINRGNISKIFGELITLIEPSKRIGKSEELRVRLPYSQEEFGVPCNLYIIGTMNTADRSITSIDTALRRRFEFVEMMPDSNKLKNLRVYEDNKDTGIELCDMLEKINKRIEFLYDREKTIGHAFFLSGCKEGEDSITLEKLKDIFQNKIIPLLQEYFYNDYALIQVVLNDNGMIIKEKQELNDLFGSQALIDELDLEVKKMYSIASDENVWNSENTYIKIYQTSQKND